VGHKASDSTQPALEEAQKTEPVGGLPGTCRSFEGLELPAVVRIGNFKASTSIPAQNKTLPWIFGNTMFDNIKLAHTAVSARADSVEAKAGNPQKYLRKRKVSISKRGTAKRSNGDKLLHAFSPALPKLFRRLLSQYRVDKLARLNRANPPAHFSNLTSCS